MQSLWYKEYLIIWIVKMNYIGILIFLLGVLSSVKFQRYGNNCCLWMAKVWGIIMNKPNKILCNSYKGFNKEWIKKLIIFLERMRI